MPRAFVSNHSNERVRAPALRPPCATGPVHKTDRSSIRHCCSIGRVHPGIRNGALSSAGSTGSRGAGPRRALARGVDGGILGAPCARTPRRCGKRAPKAARGSFPESAAGPTRKAACMSLAHSSRQGEGAEGAAPRRRLLAFAYLAAELPKLVLGLAVLHLIDIETMWRLAADFTVWWIGSSIVSLRPGPSKALLRAGSHSDSL